MSQSAKLAFDPIRQLKFDAMGAAYMGIGSEFDKPVRIFFLQNLTDATLWFSFDGVNDHFPLAANGYLLLDVTSNKSNLAGFYIAEGTRVYVKELGTPTAGYAYLTVFYSNT